MDPITQVALWALLALTIINMFRKPKALSAAPAPKAVSTGASSPDHRLVKTWIEMDSTTTLDGWRAKCSCGTISHAKGLKSATYSTQGSLGSESSAIEAYETHAKNFQRANGNPYKDQLDELQKKLDEQQAGCFCKDVSTVKLLSLKG